MTYPQRQRSAVFLLALAATVACREAHDSQGTTDHAGGASGAVSEPLGGHDGIGDAPGAGGHPAAGEAPTSSPSGAGGDELGFGAAGAVDSAAGAGGTAVPTCDPRDPTTYPTLPPLPAGLEGVALEAVLECNSISLRDGVVDPASAEDELHFSAAWGKAPYADAHELLDASLRVTGSPGTQQFTGLLELISPSREEQRWICLQDLQATFDTSSESGSQNEADFPSTFASASLSELACDPNGGAAYEYTYRVPYRVDAPAVVCSASGLCQVSFAFPDDIAAEQTLFVNVEPDWPITSTWHPSFDYSDTTYIPFASSYILYRDNPGKVACGGVGVVSKYTFHSYGDPFRGPDYDETTFFLHIDALAEAQSCPGVALAGAAQGTSTERAP